MVSEGIIEGVRTDRGVRIKRVSIKEGGGGGGFDSLYSGRSRPSDKGQGRGHPEPEIRGGAVYFSALQASVWSKNKVAPPGPFSGSATDLRRARKIINLENILGSSVSVEG